MTGVIICRTPTVRAAAFCGTCQRVRPMGGTYGLWYGATLTCCACGDTWADDWAGRAPRPFARNWRQQAIDGAVRAFWAGNPLKLEIERQEREHEEFLQQERQERPAVTS